MWPWLHVWANATHVGGPGRICVAADAPATVVPCWIPIRGRMWLCICTCGCIVLLIYNSQRYGPFVSIIGFRFWIISLSKYIYVSFCHWSLWVAWLTLKRPGLCGWLRPTQFKPRLDWVGSAAQVRRYCVDSAAQAFIHALAGCVPRSLQYALCGPRNSRPAHFAAHALDVLATHESPSLTQLST